MVRISFWSSPLSPMAFRAALMRLVGSTPIRSGRPDRGNQVVLANDAVAVLYQVNQHVEYLRLDSNRLRTAAQLTPVGIKCVIS